jgi:hypothetical protein
MPEIVIDSVASIVQPLVQRGLFKSPETAVRTLAQDYILRQIEHCRTVITQMEVEHGMNYAQFEMYLQRRSELLMRSPNIELGQAVMTEEDDLFDWKAAHEMLQSWLGLQGEIK